MLALEATKEVARRLPSAAFQVTFERPLVRPKAIALVPRPIETVMAIRAAIREAMSDAMDGGPVPEADTFQPHLSLAYSNGEGLATACLRRVGLTSAG